MFVLFPGTVYDVADVHYVTNDHDDDLSASFFISTESSMSCEALESFSPSPNSPSLSFDGGLKAPSALILGRRTPKLLS